MKRIVLASFVLVVLAPFAMAQRISLADAARLERDRRKEIGIEKAELVQEILQYSGAKDLIGELSRSFDNSTDKLFAKFPEDRREQLKKVATESFTPSKLMPIFEATFASSIDAVSLDAVSRFYQTPTGAKVLEVEIQRTGKPQEDLFKTAPPVRKRLIEDLELQTQSVDRTAASLGAMTKAMLTRMLAISPGAQSGKDAFIMGFEDGFVQNAAPQLRPSIMASHVYTYRLLSDDELQEYISFLKTPAGRRFVRATWNALEKSMVQGGSDIGAGFAQVLKEMNGSLLQ